MAELEQEFAEANARLQKHVASTPPEPEQNARLLEHLPQLGVDLNLLPPDRLRRFLDAFRVEIHYDVRTGRATFKAEISANTIQELAEQARRAADVRWRAAGAGKNVEMSDREGSAVPGEPQTIMGAVLDCAPGGSRTTWERAATSRNATFVVIAGAWPLPPRGPRSL